VGFTPEAVHFTPEDVFTGAFTPEVARFTPEDCAFVLPRCTTGFAFTGGGVCRCGWTTPGLFDVLSHHWPAVTLISSPKTLLWVRLHPKWRISRLKMLLWVCFPLEAVHLTPEDAFMGAFTPEVARFTPEDCAFVLPRCTTGFAFTGGGVCHCGWTTPGLFDVLSHLWPAVTLISSLKTLLWVRLHLKWRISRPKVVPLSCPVAYLAFHLLVVLLL